MLKDFCVRVKKNMSPAISLSESPAAPLQFLARVEEKATSAEQQELVSLTSKAGKFTSFLDKCVSGPQRHQLLQVLGNPHTPESEWLRACEVLGDYQHNPAPTLASLRILLFAVCVSASAVIFTLSMHVLRDDSTRFMVMNQSPRVLAPPPTSSNVDVSFAPYMADLQRRIKRAWFPPRDSMSRRVVVIFKVHEHGELSNLRLDCSSGSAATDRAALEAVEHAAPFRHLPIGASEPVDIQFTFDYNHFGSKLPGLFHK